MTPKERFAFDTTIKLMEARLNGVQSPLNAEPFTAIPDQFEAIYKKLCSLIDEGKKSN